VINVLIDGRVSGHDGIGRYTSCLITALRQHAGHAVRDGSVRSGCYVLPPLGNVLEVDIAEILNSADYLRRAEAMLRLECPGCACNVFKSLRTQHSLQDRVGGMVRAAANRNAAQ